MKLSVFAAILTEVRKAALEAPALYFAPLVGAFKGIRAEYAKVGRRHRH